jgi:hypothetical protein
MLKLTEDQIASLKAANPGVELFVIENDELDLAAVVKAPTWAQWRQFRLAQSMPEQKAGANKQLVASVLVQPNASEFEMMLQVRPGLADTLAAEVGEIAGISNASTHRKI